MPRIHIPDELRRAVFGRAQGCCEYCLIHQDDAPESHHIDHILSIKHGGQTVLENLALACARCNRHKGTDFAVLDPETQQPVLLFNPRAHRWNEHFALQAARIVGQTITGRVTLVLLRMNDDAVLAYRQHLINKQRYPLAHKSENAANQAAIQGNKRDE